MKRTIVFVLLLAYCHTYGQKGNSMNKVDQITLAGGCFWCVEAVYERIPGVQSVESGYAGGSTPNPTYEQVCDGNTGHAEVAQLTYDPSRVTLEEILDLFWRAHDPTTLNRQGADVGTQYRSVIFYHDAQQKGIAEKSKKTTQKDFSVPIVTEIKPLEKFYKAETYHQDYYKNNPNAPYCAFVIRPKLKKLKLE